MILFINQTWNVQRRIGLLKRLFQVLLLSVAVFTALSRISDNKHHPTDVLAGSLIGILIACIDYAILSRFHKRKNYKIIYNKLSKLTDCEESYQLDEKPKKNNVSL